MHVFRIARRRFAAQRRTQETRRGQRTHTRATHLGDSGDDVVVAVVTTRRISAGGAEGVDDVADDEGHERLRHPVGRRRRRAHRHQRRVRPVREREQPAQRHARRRAAAPRLLPWPSPPTDLPPLLATLDVVSPLGRAPSLIVSALLAFLARLDSFSLTGWVSVKYVSRQCAERT